MYLSDIRNSFFLRIERENAFIRLKKKSKNAYLLRKIYDGLMS